MKSKSTLRKILSLLVPVLILSLMIRPKNSIPYYIMLIVIGSVLITFLLHNIFLHWRPHRPAYFSQKQEECHASDTEALLWRQINLQITDKLKQNYTEATWEHLCPPKLEDLITGRPIRIRTYNTGDYNFAEFHLDQYGYPVLELLTITSLDTNSKKEIPEQSQRADPESWYNLIGKKALMELIADVNARGHKKLQVNESGDVFTQNGSNMEFKGTLLQFPDQNYWDRLIELFEQDELNAQETNNMLELSWQA